MRLGTLLVAVIAASAMLTACGEADAHRTPTQAAQPVDVLSAAFAYADDWWAGQGSPPPCSGAARITVNQTDGEHVGFGYYGSCDVEINAGWWKTAERVIQTGNRRGRRAMLAQLCLIAIHERGHNIGYRHTDTGVMRAELDSMPGGCVLWAARTAQQVTQTRPAGQRTSLQQR